MGEAGAVLNPVDWLLKTVGSVSLHELIVRHACRAPLSSGKGLGVRRISFAPSVYDLRNPSQSNP
jgi:hypothetical protein